MTKGDSSIDIYDEIIEKNEQEKEEALLLSIEQKDKDELIESISLELEDVIREYITENRLNIAQYLDHNDIIVYLNEILKN